MPLIPDMAVFQRKLATLPLATYQAGETVLSAASRPRARVRALWGLSGWRGNERIADSIKKGPPGARAGGGCCSGSDRAPNFQGSAGRERNPVRGLAQLA